MQNILLLLAVILLAHASLAEPIYVNLLPDGNKQEKIEVPLEAAELSSTLNNMLIDSGFVTQTMRTDKIKHYVDLPVIHADKRTLSAIANALMAMQKLKKNNKEYRFGPMKSIVKDFCFPRSKPATSTDLLNFLLVANYLDIRDLLRPVAAAWVDRMPKEISLKRITKEQLNKMILKHKEIPKELLPFFGDYVDWLNNPTSLIRPIGQPIAVNGRPSLVVVGKKLYVSDFETNGTVTAIDLATDQIIGDPIRVGRHPSAFADAGNKLYVANSGEATISVIDVLTDKVTGDPIAVGNTPGVLAVVNNKLYVANNERNGTISVVDLATGRVSGDPIAVGRYPVALAVVGNNLYVANRAPNGTLSVIDATTDQVIGDPIKVGSDPSDLAILGHKLYVSNSSDNTLSVIDVVNARATGFPIKVGRHPDALVIAGNKLYVANFGDETLSVIDPNTDRVMGSAIKVNSRPSALAVVGNRLYVAKYEYDPIKFGSTSATISVLDVGMFNYYNYTPDR